jgi:hypothetical protein
METLTSETEDMTKKNRKEELKKRFLEQNNDYKIITSEEELRKAYKKLSDLE